MKPMIIHVGIIGRGGIAIRLSLKPSLIPEQKIGIISLCL
jgi:hypothetical protein